LFVIPAEAGIQEYCGTLDWTPASAGVTDTAIQWKDFQVLL
jgi:hypothetical protein